MAYVMAMGKDTLVCISPLAPEATRQAAEWVLAVVKIMQPDARMLDPDTLVTDYDTLGTLHVICIGE